MTEPRELSDVDWRSSVDLALKHADLATKIVQFFVLASVAIGGWVVSSQDMRALAPLAGARIMWAVLYTLMAAPLWFALMDLQRRINALYAHVDPNLPDDLRGATRPFDSRLVAYGFPFFVLVVDLIILFLHAPAAE